MSAIYKVSLTIESKENKKESTSVNYLVKADTFGEAERRVIEHERQNSQYSDVYAKSISCIGDQDIYSKEGLLRNEESDKDGTKFFVVKVRYTIITKQCTSKTRSAKVYAAADDMEAAKVVALGVVASEYGSCEEDSIKDLCVEKYLR